jgi:RHS repeat-associated protein
VVTPGYTATGWLSGLSTKLGSATTTLASNLAYTGLAGAAGQLTSLDLGSGDSYAASYDSGLRLTSSSLTRAGDHTVMYSTQPAYDAANNVVSVQTSIGGATDSQQFCYDSLNRLTWSGTSGIPPCTGVSFAAGTLSGAQYQQSDAYNVDGGLTGGPNGSNTYGNSSHPHALMATSTGYSAAYDAVGNQTCRALTSATTCSGTQTGQQLSYDAEGRLTGWQNTPASPSASATYLYDGSGNRVAMQTTSGGTTTLTAYIGSIEEVQKTGGTTQTTTYYSVGGKRLAATVNGSFFYFGYDALGSQVLALNASGVIVGSQLYGPYGSSRYTNGSLSTSIGFTGQHTDRVSGLDYYNARYYDPVVGQFLSADTKQGNAAGMDPYAYVGGNPESRTDPTGQMVAPPGRGADGWLDDAGNQISPPREDFSRNTNSSLDPASYGAEGIAENLARIVKNARAAAAASSDRNTRKTATDNRDWAAGAWYLTDPEGNRIGGGPISIEYSNGAGQHAEQKVLEKFFASMAWEAIAELLTAYADGRIGTMLHIVIFTQHSPCDYCANYVFPTFMAAMAQIMNLENAEMGDAMGDVEDPLTAMTLDVYGSTYVPTGLDWDHVFRPGTTDTYGITDYWSDEVTYNPTGSFGFGE